MITRFLCLITIGVTVLGAQVQAQDRNRTQEPANGQQKLDNADEKDRAAIAQTVERIMDAWNRHDPHAFTLTFTEDADFTNVAGMEAHGRASIESFHAPMFATTFKDTHQTAKIRSIRFLRPELAAVDVDWQMTGAKLPDGSPRGDRKGLINSVMAKQPDGSWLFEVLHNTELTGRAPNPPTAPAGR